MFQQDQQLNTTESLNTTISQHVITLDGLSNKLRRCLKKKRVSKTSQSCSICLHQYKQGDIVLQLPCKHIFHNSRCIKDWFLSDVTCPLCRFNVKQFCLSFQKDNSKIQQHS